MIRRNSKDRVKNLKFKLLPKPTLSQNKTCCCTKVKQFIFMYFLYSSRRRCFRMYVSWLFWFLILIFILNILHELDGMIKHNNDLHHMPSLLSHLLPWIMHFFCYWWLIVKYWIYVLCRLHVSAWSLWGLDDCIRQFNYTFTLYTTFLFDDVITSGC